MFQNVENMIKNGKGMNVGDGIKTFSFQLVRNNNSWRFLNRSTMLRKGLALRSRLGRNCITPRIRFCWPYHSLSCYRTFLIFSYNKLPTRKNTAYSRGNFTFQKKNSMSLNEIHCALFMAKFKFFSH